MKYTISSAVFAFGLAAAAAHATTVQLDYQGSGPFGDHGTAEIVDVTSTDYTGYLYSGGFHMTDVTSGLGDFIAFCVDLPQFLGNQVSYEVGDLFTSDVRDEISRLYSVAGDQIGDQFGSAAFQVALWEIITDYNAAGAYDLASGGFITTKTVQDLSTMASDQSVQMAADDMLAQLGSGDAGEFTLTFFKSDTNQDLVWATPSPQQEGDINPPAVPLPASVLLLGGGLVSLTALRRRRKDS